MLNEQYIKQFLEDFKKKHDRDCIFAIDFDNTLFFTKFPEIIKPNEALIKFVKILQKYNAYLILWTCRTNIDLENAIIACKDIGITFNKINDHSDIMKERFHNEGGQKIYADYYLDDRAFNINNRTLSNNYLEDILTYHI